MIKNVYLYHFYFDKFVTFNSQFLCYKLQMLPLQAS